ncbi:MAG TPA: SDR family oxidoreductase [Acidimicrobiales bacterium]|nr:SDR family oxidoreductase [Acidimicrobiales bacterium]
MDVADRVVVVTGGASGIGRALCRAAAAQGARVIVVADIDAAGAEAVAHELGERAAAFRTDVASGAEVNALVEFAESTYGAIDIFFANAGILVPGGVEASDEGWERIWHVNVMSHVWATRALLPGMLARGEGYIVITASAAGLLTQLGSAPYSVTKHAAVGLAEWLAITHYDAGIRVSCLCPQGVWTNMTGAGQRRDLRAVAQSTAGRDGFLEAEVVADIVLAAVAEERFLILPHPEVATYEHRRADDRERWLTGMRRVQASLRPRA